MIIKNTKESRIIKRVAVTMALEGMYLDEAFGLEMLKVDKGEKKPEELRQEIIKKYARR